MTKRLLKTLENTRFAGSPVIPVAAKPGGPEVRSLSFNILKPFSQTDVCYYNFVLIFQAPDCDGIGVSQLIDTLKTFSYRPKRDASGPLIYAVDHCFSIRGQGTVMTGTVLSGSVNVNDVSF